MFVPTDLSRVTISHPQSAFFFHGLKQLKAVRFKMTALGCQETTTRPTLNGGRPSPLKDPVELKCDFYPTQKKHSLQLLHPLTLEIKPGQGGSPHLRLTPAQG